MQEPGKILYYKANQLVINGADEKSPKIISLLQKAVDEYHNFEALRTLNRFFCEAVHSGKRIDPKEHFELLKREAEHHRTLVYLMIAMTSLYYIQFDTAYAAITAEYLEKAERSQIQDQCKKEDIAASNPWEIDNIAEMRSKLRASNQ